MRGIRTHVATAAALIGLVLPATGAATASEVEASFRAPTPNGIAELGDTVAYDLELAGRDCDAVEVVAVALLDAEELSGPATRGCEGTVTVPDAAALAEADRTEHEVTGLALIARELGDEEGGAVGAELARTPLVLSRIQAERAERVDGEFEVAPANDPFSDGERLEITGSAATISLGEVDLAGIHSVALRYATPDDDSRVCSPFGYDGPPCITAQVVLTAGSPVGQPIGTLHALATEGWDDWNRIVVPLIGAPSGPVELFATITAVPPAHCGPLTTPASPFGRCGDGEELIALNYLELNGRGVAELYEPPADPEGTRVLFDGGSIDHWHEAGAGTYTVVDDRIVVRGGYGVLYHPDTFDDFELRLEYRVDSVYANSGVFLRHAPPPFWDGLEPGVTGYEVQVQDYGETYFGSIDYAQTGSIYQEVASERIATHDIGEWNHFAIRVQGHEHTVTLNGREITRFTGERLLEGHIGLQSHDPYAQVEYRNIRVLPIGASDA
jgi:hypothetical protein